MKKHFGEFECPKNPKDYFIFGFSPNSSLPFPASLWEANGLLADCLANYLTLFYPNKDVQKLKQVVSHIANELLENARKFNDQTTEDPFQIKFLLYPDRLILCSTNTIPPEKVGSFQSFLENLQKSNLEDLYRNEVKEAVKGGNTKASKLGLITMLKNYQVKLGWQFETVQQAPVVVIVTTTVQITIG